MPTYDVQSIRIDRPYGPPVEGGGEITYAPQGSGVTVKMNEETYGLPDIWHPGYSPIVEDEEDDDGDTFSTLRITGILDDDIVSVFLSGDIYLTPHPSEMPAATTESPIISPAELLRLLTEAKALQGPRGAVTDHEQGGGGGDKGGRKRRSKLNKSKKRKSKKRKSKKKSKKKSKRKSKKR
jgi:hypothetical protein